jgi:hypothetical protein
VAELVEISREDKLEADYVSVSVFEGAYRWPKANVTSVGPWQQQLGNHAEFRQSHMEVAEAITLAQERAKMLVQNLIYVRIDDDVVWQEEWGSLRRR